MIVKKSSKKPSRTPEAKEKRFLRQQEKRKKAKETKRLEKSQNETADESKPLDASIAESKTGAVKKVGIAGNERCALVVGGGVKWVTGTIVRSSVIFCF